MDEVRCADDGRFNGTVRCSRQLAESSGSRRGSRIVERHASIRSRRLDVRRRGRAFPIVRQPTLRRPLVVARGLRLRFLSLTSSWRISGKPDMRVRGAERREAHRSSHACEARRASCGDALASRRSTCGSHHHPEAMSQLRPALACPRDEPGPSASSSHRGRSAPRAVAEAARVRGCEPRARAPRQRIAVARNLPPESSAHLHARLRPAPPSRRLMMAPLREQGDRNIEKR
jgi:hypothetical protein